MISNIYGNLNKIDIYSHNANLRCMRSRSLSIIFGSYTSALGWGESSFIDAAYIHLLLSIV